MGLGLGWLKVRAIQGYIGLGLGLGLGLGIGLAARARARARARGLYRRDLVGG